MLGIDLSETREVQIDDFAWTFGLLPLGKYEALKTKLEGAQTPYGLHVRQHFPAEALTPGAKPAPEILEATATAMADCELCAKLTDIAADQARPINRDFVRWALKATTAPIALETEIVRFCGKEYAILTEASVERIVRSKRFGSVYQRLVQESIATNQIDDATALGFK